jgi:hypothetical protein
MEWGQWIRRAMLGGRVPAARGRPWSKTGRAGPAWASWKVRRSKAEGGLSREKRACVQGKRWPVRANGDQRAVAKAVQWGGGAGAGDGAPARACSSRTPDLGARAKIRPAPAIGSPALLAQPAPGTPPAPRSSAMRLRAFSACSACFVYDVDGKACCMVIRFRTSLP